MIYLQGKVILALKSLMFLSRNKYTQFFIEALSVFSKYFTENSAKISDSYKGLILKEFPCFKTIAETHLEINSLTDSLHASKENKVSVEFFNLKARCFLNNKDFFIFKDSVLKLDCVTLRSIPFSVSIKIYSSCLMRLFFSSMLISQRNTLMISEQASWQ